MGLFSSWMNNAATDFEGFSRWLTKLFRPGVATGLTVTQRGAGANMSVDVQVGDAAPMTTNSSAWGWSTAVENVVIGAASANNRRDVVVAYTDLSVTNPSTATPNNPGALKFVAVQGTPATSPSDPSASTIQTAVGAGNPYTILARVSLTSSTTQITNAQITSLITPMALQNVRIWGGSNSTLGHQIPDVADGYLAITSRSDGKTGFAELMSTIFSGQVTTYANPGSAGGTFYYINLGGIKLFWGQTASVSVGATSGFVASSAVDVTLPASFFSTIQLAVPKIEVPINTNFLDAEVVAKSAATISVKLLQNSGSNGASPIQLFVIGT